VSKKGAAIIFDRVSKAFQAGGLHVQALDDVSIQVKPGIVTGLIGPDGAGKTTLMRLCAGLLVPDRGGIHVLGMDVTKESLDIQSSIGYMPQRFGLYEDLTVQENMDLYADLQGVTGPKRPERYNELLNMAGLAPFTRRLAGRLSGGMKQKLGLVCTLVQPPRLLLLDEPTVGVDPVSRRELWNIVYRLVREEHMTVLLSTAYLDEAERCDEVILLHKGRILGHDTPSSFSEKVRGRCYYVLSPSMRKRTLQAALSRQKGILDALILGRGVRVITDTPSLPDPLLPDAKGDIQVEAVEPRFEDSFIALLKDKTLAEPSGVKGLVMNRHISGEASEDVIVVRDLVRKFGDFYAVKGVNFTVKQGEVFGLLGANGAGKTTTFRMLCGLLPITDGHIEVAGMDLRRAAASARARIGYMAQRFSLYENLTVLQNLSFFGSVYGLKRRHKRRRIDWALSTFELEEYKDVDSKALPLGYKQRLALSAALLHEPEILFLDEPTSGVDPLARREFWARINALAESGVTVLVTTHFMEEAEYCDRLIIMAQGEVLAAGTPEEMKARFATPENPDPSLEDAFIGLLEAHESREAGR